MRLRTIVVSVVSGVVLLAACGSDHGGHSAASVEVSPDAAFNAADVMFAQGMIPHHQQAIEMADMALDPAVGAGPAVLDLATRIKAGQDPEIAQMTTWLADWDQPTAMDLSDGHTMDGMDGMLSADEMKDLAALRGAEFDTAWMEGMIRHHEGAITMAEDVAAKGEQPEVKALAEQIVAAQRAEIDEMRALLDS
ncbi:MAG: DUF305 domain-containing protein [Actinomycetota bacterium]